MQSCAKHLEAALTAAAKHSPAMAGIFVEPDHTVEAGVSRETLTAWRTSFYLRVERRTPPETGDDGWHYRAESLKGAYHRSDIRTGPKGSAFVAFDGVPMAAAIELAPMFTAAVDRCFE